MARRHRSASAAERFGNRSVVARFQRYMQRCYLRNLDAIRVSTATGETDEDGATLRVTHVSACVRARVEGSQVTSAAPRAHSARPRVRVEACLDAAVLF